MLMALEMEPTVALRRLDAVLVYLAKRTDGGWEYLLLRRVARLGGFWQGVTGGVDGSESPLQAAEREVLEETGFSPASFHPINFPYVFPIPDELRHLYHPSFKEFVSHRFVAEVEGGEPQLSLEHDAWKWCGLDEAMSLLRHQNDAEALRRGHSLLSKGL